MLLLYGLIAFAGLRTARRAKSPYAKLLATGLTSLILCQAILNIFVVLGIAPLTGVPLPFISYAPTNLLRDARRRRPAPERRAPGSARSLRARRRPRRPARGGVG